MNKALINKYWKEFCHWKDDGKVEVFIGLATGNSWTTISPNYPWTSPNAILVISDEYVEYRKKICELEQELSQLRSNRGSCGECKHMEVIDSGAGIISCTRATFDPIEPDFFCADFERKVNEN